MKPYTLFVADLHLDASRPDQVQTFARFLNTEAKQAQALYILGDLFEYWIGDDDPAEGLDEVIEALRVLAAAGVPVKLLHGNRDFLLGDAFARRTGCEILPTRLVIDLHGTLTLIEHGDLLCTDDVAYQRYRRRIRHPCTLGLLRRLPKATRTRMGRHLRRVSARAISGKPADIMDVNDETVRRVMRDEGVFALIHGHTHRPGIHHFRLDGAEAVRAVLGDWYEQGSWLVADGDGLHSQAART